jgi:hypothetical protein
VHSRAALIRDLILVPVPFCLLAAGFFIAGVTEGGILMLICAIAGAWFVSPRRQKPPPDADWEPNLPEQSPPAGTGGGGPV